MNNSTGRSLSDRSHPVVAWRQAQLAQEYPNQYVAVYKGQVVDYDPDEGALTRRVAETYPRDTVMVRYVAA